MSSIQEIQLSVDSKSASTNTNYEPTLLDKKIIKIANEPIEISQLNLPKTNEFIINSKGLKVHVRSHLSIDANQELSMLIILLHGYGVHNNVPWNPILGEEFNKENIGLITFDFHGHGYSEGVGVDIANQDDLIDDCLSLLSCLYPDNTNEKMNGNLLKSNFKCPYFIAGSSLGGLVTLGTGLKIQKKIKDQTSSPKKFFKYFKGCILFAPAITIELPDAFTLSFLQVCIVPCFPLSPVPSFLSQPDLDPLLEIYPEYLPYIKKDEIDSKPPGLSYGSLVRFRAGLSIVTLTKSVQDTIQEIDFPFLVFHDPEDIICKVDGTLDLMKLSQTSNNLKQYIPVLGGLHGIIPNRTGEVLPIVINWMKEKVIIG